MQRLLLVMSAVVWLVVPYNVANKSFRKHHRPVWELHHKGHEHCTQLREMSCIDEDTLDDMLQPGYVVGALKCNNFTTIAHPGVFILFRFNLPAFHLPLLMKQHQGEIVSLILCMLV